MERKNRTYEVVEYDAGAGELAIAVHDGVTGEYVGNKRVSVQARKIAGLSVKRNATRRRSKAEVNVQ